MIRTLLIEDEEAAASRLEKMLTRLDPEIEIVARIDSVEGAVRWLTDHQPPDLMILDIQLGDGLSFEIFRKVRVESFVIFTTAYDEYAIKAFELNSIDYLLKPVDESKLSLSLHKFKKLRSRIPEINLERLLEAIDERKEKFKKRFIINIGNKIRVIETHEVAYFYSLEKNTFLCTSDGHHYPLDFSIDHLEQLVNPEVFFRINRQYLIQYRSISRIHILSRSRIKIESNPPSREDLLVSSNRTHEFRQWLDR
jgi:DNA-binding LytR/AlgR family response regulator